MPQQPLKAHPIKRSLAFSRLLIVAIIVWLGSCCVLICRPICKRVYFHRIVDKILRHCSRLIMAIVDCRVTLHLPNSFSLPGKQPRIYMSNHSSLLDLPAMYAMIPGSVRVIAKPVLFNIPFFGWALRATGAVSSQSKHFAACARDMHADKYAIWCFPEGTRCPEARLSTLRVGVFNFARQLGAEIVPVATIGGESALPAQSFNLQPHKNMQIHIGNPIDCRHYTNIEQQRSLMDRVADEIKALRKNALQRACYPLFLNEQTDPYLASHKVLGKFVLPTATIVERCMRAVNTFCPKQSIVACHDLSLLRGITLQSLQDVTKNFTLHCQVAKQANYINVSVCDETEKTRYRMRFELAKQARLGAIVDHASYTKSWPWNAANLYKTTGDDFIIFHGSDFQIIEDLLVCDEKGASVQLKSLHTMGWPQQDWQVDVALLDGVFQSIGLWGEAQFGGRGLQTSIKRIDFFQPRKLPQGSLVCYLSAQAKGDYGIQADAWVVDKNNCCYLALRGVELYFVERDLAGLTTKK